MHTYAQTVSRNHFLAASNRRPLDAFAKSAQVGREFRVQNSIYSKTVLTKQSRPITLKSSWNLVRPRVENRNFSLTVSPINDDDDDRTHLRKSIVVGALAQDTFPISRGSRTRAIRKMLRSLRLTIVDTKATNHSSEK